MQLMQMLIVSAAALLLTATPRSAWSQQEIKSYSADGNLEETFEIGCISISQAKSNYSPADLHKGISKCISERNYADAASMYALAEVYGRFDSLRVSDKSAHQALRVLSMTSLGDLTEGQQQSFGAEINRISGDPSNLASLCSSIRALGQPDYFPRYMIQHGIRAISSDQSDSLNQDFDPDAAWKISLESHLHCPALSCSV